MPSTGWWWSAAEPGSGYAIEVQGNQLFLIIAAYDPDGHASWSVAAGPLVSPNLFQGTLFSFVGGQALLDAYHAPAAAQPVGSVSLQFLDSQTATITLPTGRSLSLTRFQF